MLIYRHCERSEAIQGSCVALDCFVADNSVHALFAREPEGANREERLAGSSLAMTL